MGGEMTLLCKDCLHADIETKHCMHPFLSAKIIDYFTGKTTTAHPTCQQARTIGDCEPDGKLWESRGDVGFGEPRKPVSAAATLRLTYRFT